MGEGNGIWLLLRPHKDSPFTYTGHFWHAQSGLNLALYRAYDPNLGRWISRDPIAEYDGHNIYLYVSNNPINYTDKLGLLKDPLGVARARMRDIDRQIAAEDGLIATLKDIQFAFATSMQAASIAYASALTQSRSPIAISRAAFAYATAMAIAIKVAGYNRTKAFKKRDDAVTESTKIFWSDVEACPDICE